MISEGDKRLVKRIIDNCELLYNGYDEKVEYRVGVTYHRHLCEYHGARRSSEIRSDCECPVVNEARIRKIKRPALLDQLQNFAANKDTDRNPKSERGAPRVKVPGRPPGDVAGFMALDEIISEINMTVDQMLTEVGRDRTWASQPARSILMSLGSMVAGFIASRPDVARSMDIACQRWVDSARSTLKITVGDSIFDSVVCGDCQGGLTTPWGNRGDHPVRCAGTPSTPPCGRTYPMSEWIKLYEDHKGRSSRDQ